MGSVCICFAATSFAKLYVDVCNPQYYVSFPIFTRNLEGHWCFTWIIFIMIVLQSSIYITFTSTIDPLFLLLFLF